MDTCDNPAVLCVCVSGWPGLEWQGRVGVWVTWDSVGVGVDGTVWLGA